MEVPVHFAVLTGLAWPVDGHGYCREIRQRSKSDERVEIGEQLAERWHASYLLKT